MPLPDMLAFIGLAALGSFVQALSGFALGLIVLGCVTLLQLAPIPFTAAVISMISLVTGSWVLSQHPSNIQWRSVAWTVAGLIPAVGLGLALLAHLDTQLPGLLRRLLGLVILSAGLLLMLRPHPHAQPSGRLTTLLSGIAGGLLGGLFSTAGPPVVFHLYRQPWTLSAIRSTLLAIFVISTLVRIGWQSTRGELHWPMIEVALYCTLPVLLAAHWGAHIAPRIAPQRMRQLAFGLLALSGIGLLLPAHNDLGTLPRTDQSLDDARSAATLPAPDHRSAVGAAVSGSPAAPARR
ncbi:MAG: sulfite exporter TauE/SafE family protein [Gammaproteobacteria bacterium]|nr:sulfite exporter TauE/SafE family protein [Gammaproteobacteria bacterium]